MVPLIQYYQTLPHSTGPQIQDNLTKCTVVLCFYNWRCKQHPDFWSVAGVKRSRQTAIKLDTKLILPAASCILPKNQLANHMQSSLRSSQLQLALFDMQNSYRFDILSISIFSEISLSISIFYKISLSISISISISIFSRTALSISIFSRIALSISISIFLEWPYRYRNFPNLPIYRLSI